MEAKDMFEKLGYNYYSDDGFTEYLKAVNVPDRINTEYIKFKKISFDRSLREISVHTYKKDALCQEMIENESYMKINILDSSELQAINQQCKELGWIK